MACLPIVSCTLLQKDLKVGCLEGGYLQTQALSRRVFDRAIPREVLTRVWPRSHGFDPASRHTATWYRQQTNATFLFAKDSPWALI